MKITGQVVRLGARVFLLSLVVILCFIPVQSPAQDYSACEQVVTNASQLAGVFGCDTFCLPTDPLDNRAWLIDPQFLWADFASLPKQFGEAFAQSKDQVQRVAVVKLRLTRFLLSGETIVGFPYNTKTLTLAAPTGYSTKTVDSASRSALLTWQQWITWGEISPNTSPTLSLDVALADIQDKAAYDAALAAEETASVEASAKSALSLGGMGLLESEDSGGGGVETLAVYEVDFCQGIPVTAISQVATNIRLNWVSITNDTYAVQYANNMEWFNTWHLIGDNITSASSNAVWDDVGVLSNTNVPKRFYRVVRKDASYGIPCVTISSPTNGATMSGTVNVSVYATDDSRISSVTLVIDGTDFATITDGPMSFPVPTALFSNGMHAIYARAADNAGLPGLGGNPDSDVVANVATSQTVQVSFQNNIFLTSFELFQSQLPIQANLTYSNASCSIQIEREDGTVLKNFSGTTSNGTISVTWDGTDNSAVAVPSKTNYFVTVTATPLGQFAASSTTTDSVTKATYREAGTSTGHILLARQKLKQCCLPPSRFLWEGVSAQKLLNIRSTISINDPNDTDNENGVYLDTIFVMQADADWDTLRNELADPDPREITAFYYNGHTIGDKMGYHEFTRSKGLDYAEVASALNNLYYFSPKKGTWVATFGTPYKFVFLDGCLSGTGPWPRAFGILKNQMNYNVVGAKNRAFLGWGDLVESSLFGNAHDNFTQRFWQRWTEDANRFLSVAIQQALDATSGVDGSKLTRFGHQSLTWGE